MAKQLSPNLNSSLVHHLSRHSAKCFIFPPAHKARSASQLSKSSTNRSRAFLSQGCKRSKRSTEIVVHASSRGSESTLEETAALDQLIDILLSAKDNTELGKAVADNLLAFDQKFWIRLATRSDTASSQEQKDRIGDLAGQVMRMVEALVKQSEHQITDSAGVLQKILSAAADERGEWQVPLTDECLEAMRKGNPPPPLPMQYCIDPALNLLIAEVSLWKKVLSEAPMGGNEVTGCIQSRENGEAMQEMEANAQHLDESLLATATAWMRKANEDKLEGMVVLLQQVLQLYAARALVVNSGGTQEADDQVLDQVLSSRETTWLQHLKAATDAGKVSGSSFLAAVRRRMESIVLALPSGSNAQRIQAEYLKEVESRAETLFKELRV